GHDLTGVGADQRRGGRVGECGFGAGPGGGGGCRAGGRGGRGGGAGGWRRGGRGGGGVGPGWGGGKRGGAGGRGCVGGGCLWGRAGDGDGADTVGDDVFHVAVAEVYGGGLEFFGLGGRQQVHGGFALAHDGRYFFGTFRGFGVAHEKDLVLALAGEGEVDLHM